MRIPKSIKAFFWIDDKKNDRVEVRSLVLGFYIGVIFWVFITYIDKIF